MALQARAAATRQAVLNAAVEVFGEVGYGNASLSEVIDRAGVSKGAAFYHFRSKESVAVALMDEADRILAEAAAQAPSTPGSSLEKLIRSTLGVADLIERDAAVRCGLQLRQGQRQISAADARGYARQRDLIIGAVRAAIQEGDVRPEIDPAEVGHVVSTGVVGNQVLSQASGESLSRGLLTLWRLLVRLIATDGSAAFFAAFLDRLSHHYSVTLDPP